MEPATAARVWVAVASALGGLAVGSFLNVVVHRLPRGMSVVRPASHCPACGTGLRSVDNVPLVSWLALRGRCRTCGVRIPVRYPLVELGTAVAFLGVALATGAAWALVPLLVVVAAAVAAAAVDADGEAVPRAVAGAAGLGALALVPVAAATGRPGRIGWAALGAATCAVAVVIADRRAGMATRGAVTVALGWAAGWLWAPGGPVFAAWVLVVVAVSAAVGGGGSRPGRLAVVVAGAYGLLVAGAAVGLPH